MLVTPMRLLIASFAVALAVLGSGLVQPARAAASHRPISSIVALVLKLIDSVSEEIAKAAAAPLRIERRRHRDTSRISLRRQFRYGLEITWA